VKKELLAAGLLAAMLIAAFVNIHYICRLTGEVADLSALAEDAAVCGDWEGAARYAQRAIDRWSAADSYTHIVLRHGEIDAVSDALYDLLAETCAESSGSAEAAAQRAAYHLNSIAGMERIRFGSLF